MIKRITCIVVGRVQGVLYRDFAKRRADKLGIKGEVENLPDGAARIEAEGAEESLREFKSAPEQGSAFSKVESVICEPHENLLGYKDFKIKRKSLFS